MAKDFNILELGVLEAIRRGTKFKESGVEEIDAAIIETAMDLLDRGLILETAAQDCGLIRLDTSDDKQLTEQLIAFWKSWKVSTKPSKTAFVATFKKKYRKKGEWRTIVPLLAPAFERESEWRKKQEQSGKFLPPWKMLATWVGDKRCWEQVLPDSADEPTEHMNPAYAAYQRWRQKSGFPDALKYHEYMQWYEETGTFAGRSNNISQQRALNLFCSAHSAAGNVFINLKKLYDESK